MTAKKCAFLTMQDPGEFVMDYELSFAAMAAQGWIKLSLYLRTDESAAARFAAAFDKNYLRKSA
jgi:hypothetical protein